ncbi:LON peptidase substrate-binding domain-containing protein [Pseudoxanthomonas daejeonensis]|uniref:ATP-dependent protease n=1 Tax=Pseudoxanthomonas daejeonensis TaxID=266062 RepID=A0ABQ6Z8C8_9GAMM|nr:LON peptidase substrate-binding domain-containing protein [Pseudoxanthomonas daejeonensis]KAF1695438.1 ATP-dependent protease [Pseudoxanthomonas daejeonensis]
MPVTDNETLPLFPLHTVLLPGAPLGLRVFERRYLDLVAECGRSGQGFGICLILEGEETGEPAIPAAYGVEAQIEDFGSDRNGLLTLQVRGLRRFRVARTRVRDNGLLVGDVQWCDEAGVVPLQPQHAALATLLAELLDKVGGEYPDLGHATANLRQLEDASWVGWRLAELLPVTDEQRLALLQEDDPHRRLDRLLEWMDEEA